LQLALIALRTQTARLDEQLLFYARLRSCFRFSGLKVPVSGHFARKNQSKRVFGEKHSNLIPQQALHKNLKDASRAQAP
jgi:hypothetical protein